jgi:solute carrier family 41
MLFTGMHFESSVKQRRFRDYPIILESGCILSFKGNIELNLAMHLSSLRSHCLSSWRFYHTALGNFCATLAQSFVIGLAAGCMGLLSSLLNSISSPSILVGIPTAAMLTCCASSVIFFVVLLFSIELVPLSGICAENFILPILSTLNDFVIVKGLLFSTEMVNTLSVKECIVIDFALLCLFVVVLLFSIRAKNLVLPCAILALGTSYVITIISGFVLERCSAIFLHIAAAFPVSAGMCGSIAFIYMHQKFRLLQDREQEQASQHTTLLLISLIVAVLYVCIARILDFRFTLRFSVMFVLMFICQVSIILLITEVVSKYLRRASKHDTTDALPIVSCISDLLSVIVLVATAFFLHETV